MKQLLQHKILGSALLIAGTTIGAGMLALPVVTGVAGTLPAFILYIVCFLFMLLSVFYLSEMAFYCDDDDINLISIIQKRLGPVSQVCAWGASLLLLYAVVAAYIAGGGELMNATLGKAGLQLPYWATTLLFAVMFGTLVYFHTVGVDYVNKVLMLGLIGTFFALVFIILSESELDLFKPGNPKYLLTAVPVVVLAFTSHIIIPSIKHYLHHNPRSLTKALLYGSTIPLLCYLLWQCLLIGSLSEADVWTIARDPQPVTAIAYTIGVKQIATIIILFSFFALLTSFLGATLSLIDFLADGLHINKTVSGRLLLLLISLIPPVLFALYYPNGFIFALGYAGVFVAILYGILPALAVWRARYIDQLPRRFFVPGGKCALILMMVGSIVIIIFQIGTTLHWFPQVS